MPDPEGGGKDSPDKMRQGDAPLQPAGIRRRARSVAGATRSPQIAEGAVANVRQRRPRRDEEEVMSGHQQAGEESSRIPAVVSLDEKFAQFSEHWSPKIVGELNGQMVKLAKFRGPFEWHHHEGEDEMFLVHRGSFRMELRDRTVTLNAGDFLIVPRGVEHRPVADEEVEVILFEPAGTLNTGDVRDAFTVEELDQI